MKRDMELVREILMKLADDEGPSGGRNIAIAGHPSPLVNFHVIIMAEAGLLKTVVEGDEARAIRLTWQGCDFLDAARNETVWNRVKDVAGQAGGMAFEVLKALLVATAIDTGKRLLKLPPD